MIAIRNCTYQEEHKDDLPDKDADYEFCLNLEMQVLEFKHAFNSFR